MKAKHLCLLAFSLAVAASGLHAQRTNAQITGIITDATGAIIPNADIVVTNEATGIKRNAASNELGYYTVALLPPGKYKVAVRKDGFRLLTRTGITLEVDQAARIDFSMEVGSVAEAVEVTANASKVDTQTATLKEVVDERRIRELPLNGRDANQLIFLLPDVYNTNDTSGLQQGGSARGVVQPGVASNGARQHGELQPGRRISQRHIHEREPRHAEPRCAAGVQCSD
jgi:hypothetical protein